MSKYIQCLDCSSGFGFKVRTMFSWSAKCHCDTMAEIPTVNIHEEREQGKKDPHSRVFRFRFMYLNVEANNFFRSSKYIFGQHTCIYQDVNT